METAAGTGGAVAHPLRGGTPRIFRCGMYEGIPQLSIPYIRSMMPVYEIMFSRSCGVKPIRAMPYADSALDRTSKWTRS